MGIKAFFERLFSKSKSDSLQNQSEGNVKKDGTMLVCVDCKSTFLFESGEQKFFKMRGLTPPKRCPPCRIKKRQRR